MVLQISCSTLPKYRVIVFYGENGVIQDLSIEIGAFSVGDIM